MGEEEQRAAMLLAMGTTSPRVTGAVTGEHVHDGAILWSRTLSWTLANF
jgi:hypothetical protein